jgi:hypothetical protein
MKTAVSVCLSLTLLVPLVPAVASAQDSQVPPSYQGLNTYLNQQLMAFNQKLDSLGGSMPKAPVAYAAALVNADANIGPQVLRSAFHPELQEMQAMGMQAVMVHVGFPMLYEPFFSSQTQFQQYVDFYRGVANAIRQAGMLVIVENDTLPQAVGQNPWNPGSFYAGLNWTQYQQARAQGAAAVAETMQPDYMVILEEPDTEAVRTGQSNVNTVSGATLLATGILSSLSQTGVPGMKVSAGVGSWQPSGEEYVKAFVKLKQLDTIDIHIYPANHANLPTALKLAQLANAAGKPASISECWLNKLTNKELGVLTPLQTEARDSYGFWAPLDGYFLRTLQNFAAKTNMAFISIFESHYFWAYLNYDSIKTASPSVVLKKEGRAAGHANQRAEYSGTGLAYYNICVPVPDTTPPSAPAHLAGSSAHTGSATLKWGPSTDKIGVAGYYLQRDGVRIAATSAINYTDTGLVSGQTYSYFVKSFDLAGNISAASKTVQVQAH